MNLPLFKKIFEYASLIVDILEGMPKKYRFSIGENLLKSALSMFRHISHANRTRGDERIRHIDEFLAEYDTSIALVRLCNEKKTLTEILEDRNRQYNNPTLLRKASFSF